MKDPTAAPPSVRFAGVEGLRAVAALTVVVSHVGIYSESRGQDLLGRMLSGTQTGVTLFFLISGFLLYRPFLVARQRGTRVAIRAYARRRFFRIGPPYWVLLTLFAIWPGLGGNVLGDEALKYYGFAQIYGHYDYTAGIGPAWSLCTEVLFYASLPLIAVLLRRVGQGPKGERPVREMAVLVALAAGSIVFHSYAAANAPYGWNGISRTLLANFDWFALGMIIAILSVSSGRTTRLITAVVGRPGIAVPAAVLVYVVMSTRSQPLHALQGVACFLVLAPVVLGRGGGLLHRTLTSRVLTFLGLVSYSIFLIHDPVAQWLAAEVTTGFVPLLTLTLAVTIPLSFLSYHFIEAPSMQLGHTGRAKREAATGRR